MKLTNWTRWLEPVGDFAIAGVLLIFALPLVALIALAIKLDSPGPVFYREERIGPGGYRYRALKFRTMSDDSERDGGLIRGVQRDDQFTRVGWCLWYTRLEKLPQLINVLSGKMSCIGSNPQRPHFLS
jgi:lipopolysaccharide/colanic/teichoic acid biosynthesis glycosyltransferase